jgi:rpoC_TIGR: DNA-directed RNA polymerase, beta' subunit
MKQKKNNGKGSFKAEMGAEAIRKLLAEINIEKLSEKLKKN